MSSAESLKQLVREKYGEIAGAGECGTNCCCGVAETSASDYTIFAEDYTKLPGYNPAADLKLGCGVPTEYAAIRVGDVVLDLGSGAGNDAFVARALVGPTGRVLGVDMTGPMIEKARANAAALGFSNVEFRLGEIEALPVEPDSIDVVISNCVLNLVPDKPRALAEIYRVLKPGAHFSISDVVLSRDLPAGLQHAAEMYAGCVAGALRRDIFLEFITAAGFAAVRVQSEKGMTIPEDVLAKHLTADEVAALRNEPPLVRSVTVYGEKPTRG